MYRLFRPTWIAAILIAAITIYVFAIFAAMAQSVQHAVIKSVPLIPPAIYDKPYNGKLTMQIVKDPVELKQLCRGVDSRACALFSLPRLADGSSATCRIFMLPHDNFVAMGLDPKNVLRHERAHCVGWPSNHEIPK